MDSPIELLEMSEDDNRIEIRPVHPDDATALYEIVSHPDVARTLLQLPSMEFPQTQAWMKRSGPGRFRLVAEKSGRVVGAASLTRPQRPRLDHSALLGLMVHPGFWNQGVGSSLVAALIDLADNWLNLKRIELGVFTANQAAIHLYGKFGFVLEGTRRQAVYGNGRWHDEHVMARLRLNGYQASPMEALPLERESTPEKRVTTVRIRPQHPNDVDDLHHLWRHPLVDRTTLQMPSMEFTQAADRVENQLEGLHRLVAELEGRVVGAIGLHQSRNPRLAHSAGLGVIVDPEYWGQRIGMQLLHAALDLADNWLNLKRVELSVNVDNPSAIRLYRRNDFVIEGTHRLHTYGDGRWADSYFMARLQEIG